VKKTDDIEAVEMFSLETVCMDMVDYKKYTFRMIDILFKAGHLVGAMRYSTFFECKISLQFARVCN